MKPSQKKNDLRGLNDDIQLLKNQKHLSNYIHVDDSMDVSKYTGVYLGKIHCGA